MRIVALFCATVLLAGCAVMRAKEADNAKTKMIGLSKERVLACMGPPASKAVEGATEVWSYNSGNGYVAGSTFSTANVTAHYGYASGFGSGFGVSKRRFCTVNVVMNQSKVAEVNYVGPTGGLLTAGEQCAYAVANCLR